MTRAAPVGGGAIGGRGKFACRDTAAQSEGEPTQATAPETPTPMRQQHLT